MKDAAPVSIDRLLESDSAIRHADIAVTRAHGISGIGRAIDTVVFHEDFVISNCKAAHVDVADHSDAGAVGQGVADRVPTHGEVKRLAGNSSVARIKQRRLEVNRASDAIRHKVVRCLCALSQVRRAACSPRR